MGQDKTSILLSDVSIQGDLIEKEKVVIDAKINGDINANEVDTSGNANITGNINAKKVSIGGKIKGNLNSDKINIKKTGNVDGVLNQKVLSIEEGATLKIKSETYK